MDGDWVGKGGEEWRWCIELRAGVGDGDRGRHSWMGTPYLSRQQNSIYLETRATHALVLYRSSLKQQGHDF